MKSRQARWSVTARVAGLASAVATLLGPSALSAQWVVGVQGGLPGFTVAGRAPEGASYGRQFRVMASAMAGYRFGSSLVLRLEPGLVQKGAGVAYEVDGVEAPVDSLSLNLDYLSVPLVVQVFTPGGRGFVTAGAELGSLTAAKLSTVNGSDEVDVKDLLDGQDLAWMFGVGGLVRRTQPQVSLELRYNQSLKKVFEGDSGTSGLPTALRSSGLSLVAGVSWNLGDER
jgi:hypothetical protein